MNERIVSPAYGADDPGLPSPPAVTDIRHTHREQSRNAFAHAEPPLGPTVPAAVRRWKLWLLTVCGIYPTIVLLGLATNPVLEDLYLPVRLAVLVPAAAAAMVWQINPRLQRHFGAWLTR
jgi:antibiotic biosynthesis monooxygenase (ABM) superfamily enzyme